MVNAAYVGETTTGFQKGLGRGPFKCGNCVFYKHDTCRQPVMIQISAQPRTSDGYPKVDDDDCCTYVRRPGDK